MNRLFFDKNDKFKSILSMTLLGLFFTFLQAQENPLFMDTSVPTVRISIDADSLDWILNPENSASNYEYPARFIFDDGLTIDTVENIGFRIRGNTSRQSSRKSFKVSFNTFEAGRKFHGLEKLNLNGEHNDPSVIRAKLAWDLFKSLAVPSSRANHVNLYINDDYFGLFINVEHIDENFVDDRFGNNDGNLYKCLYPADLDYRGTDPEEYKWIEEGQNRRTYELKTNEELDDYSDLANFIMILNTLSDENFTDFEAVFNVDAYLRTLAVDVATGSWDNYWYLNNNYYLYHNSETGLFEFIPYDYDNTFGIDWVGQDWAYRDIYNWGNDFEVRPLANRILAVQEYRDRYSYYLNGLLNGAFHPDNLFPKIDAIFNMISGFAEIDTLIEKDWGFTYDDFVQSYDDTVYTQFGHVDYGLKPYITQRRNSALAQLELNNIYPIIRDLEFYPKVVQVDQDIHVTVRVEDDNTGTTVQIPNSFNGLIRAPVNMYDDGLHNDGAAGDFIYGTSIAADSNRASGQILFYISARDVQGNSSSLPRNIPQDLFSITVGFDIPKLFINEFMSSNATIISDELAEFDDWVELYNGDSIAISLGDKYLTDNLSNPDKWQLPDMDLQPGEFLLIWADNDPEQGDFHTNYNLDTDGEQLGIFRAEGNSYVPVDTFSFTAKPTDISYGRTTDGASSWQLFANPTPGATNAVATAIDEKNIALPQQFSLHQNYPNPFNPSTRISYQLAKSSNVDLSIYNLLGQKVATLVSKKQAAGSYIIEWDAAAYSSGVYFYKLDTATGFTATKKLILLK